MGQLLKLSASPYMTFLRSFLTPWTAETADTFHSGQVQRVYCRVNPFQPKMRYIGRHFGPQHLRDDNALVNTSRAHTLPRAKTLYNQRLSAKYGGAGMFIDMPVFFCGPTATVIDTHRIEQRFANQFGTMQGTDEFKFKHANKCAQKTPRRRPVQRLRFGRQKKHDVQATNCHTRPTIYSTADRSSADFCAILRHIGATTTNEVRVRVDCHPCDFTNIAQAKHRFGATSIAITFTDDLHIVTTVARWAKVVRMVNNPIGYEKVRYIDVLDVKIRNMQQSPYETAMQVGKHPHSSRRLAREVCYNDLVLIWRAARSIPDRRIKMRAEEQLLSISKKKFKVSLKAQATIAVPASVRFPTHLIAQAGKSLLKRIANQNPEVHDPVCRMLRSIRVTRSRAQTVGGTLINNIGACQDFDPNHPPDCTCKAFPKGWRRTRQFEGHFCILSSEYDGPGQTALHGSHKSPFEIEATDIYAELTRSLWKMVRTLPLYLQTTVQAEDLQSIVKQTVIRSKQLVHDARSSSRSDSSTVVQKRDVIAAKNFLQRKGAVVSAVDKGAGLLCIMCPVVNWQIMRQAWPNEPHRCTVICPANATAVESEQIETEIIAGHAKEFHAKNWQRIATLSGIDSNGKTQSDLLPRGYANPKLKSIRAALPGRSATNKIKGRPISPHTRHPLKNVYNRVAAAHHFLLTQINTQRVTRLWDTASYVTRLRDETESLQHTHSARGGGQLKFLYRFGDLDGMYTDLSFKRMSESLRSNIARVRESTSNTTERKYPLRNLDRLCVGRSKSEPGHRVCTLGPAYNHAEQVEIRFTDLTDVCDYSNHTSIMRVGREIRRYLQGTPMGEQGSCAKANGVCLDDELRIDAAREAEFGDSERNLSLAFVDDKHARVAYDDILWSRESAQQYIDLLMTYSAPLKMVIEPITRDIEFLETLTVYPIANGVGAYAKHKDRPWDNCNSYRIARGGVSGMRRVQTATATGTFMRILDNCTNESDAAIAISKELYKRCSAVPGCWIHRRQRHYRNWRNRTQKTETKNANALVFTNVSTL